MFIQVFLFPQNPTPSVVDGENNIFFASSGGVAAKKKQARVSLTFFRNQSRSQFRIHPISLVYIYPSYSN
jgi:hypothetical protein